MVTVPRTSSNSSPIANLLIKDVFPTFEFPTRPILSFLYLDSFFEDLIDLVMFDVRTLPD